MNQSINNSTSTSLILLAHDEYRNPMDILSVKILFILLYVVVFLTCFIGELLAAFRSVCSAAHRYSNPHYLKKKHRQRLL